MLLLGLGVLAQPCAPTQLVVPRVRQTERQILCEELHAGDLIVDVGLDHDSQFFQCQNLSGFELMGFEPNPTSCKTMQIATAAKGFRAAEIRCKAVSNVTGGTTLLHGAHGIQPYPVMWDLCTIAGSLSRLQTYPQSCQTDNRRHQ